MNQNGKHTIFVGGLTPQDIRLTMFSLRDELELSQIYYSTVHLVDELYTLIATEMRSVKKDISYWQRLAESSLLQIYLTQLHNRVYRDYIGKVLEFSVSFETMFNFTVEQWKRQHQLGNTNIIPKISVKLYQALQSISRSNSRENSSNSVHNLTQSTKEDEKIDEPIDARNDFDENNEEYMEKEQEEEDDDVDRHLAILHADFNTLAYLLALVDEAAAHLKLISNQVVDGYTIGPLVAGANGLTHSSSSSIFTSVPGGGMLPPSSPLLSTAPGMLSNSTSNSRTNSGIGLPIEIDTEDEGQEPDHHDTSERLGHGLLSPLMQPPRSPPRINTNHSYLMTREGGGGPLSPGPSPVSHGLTHGVGALGSSSARLSAKGGTRKDKLDKTKYHMCKLQTTLHISISLMVLWSFLLRAYPYSRPLVFYRHSHFISNTKSNPYIHIPPSFPSLRTSRIFSCPTATTLASKHSCSSHVLFGTSA